LDNKWINTIIYRTYVWRKRCTACNFCVKYCPVNRFVSVNDRPKAKGTCALCFGCVNHCPRNAMQMRFWTEYGQPYKSRWPQYIIKPQTTKKV
jgi:Pyruvate/2-oxoacid:ferredoxin oxidoreductase delta subunit